jgi:predicted nucleotidyltransferase
MTEKLGPHMPPNPQECWQMMEAYGTPALLCEVGSTAHGTGVSGTDDLDLLGVVIPSRRDLCGLHPFDHHLYRTAASRTGKSDAKSEPGDVDLTIYSLRKFVGLAKKGNPSILMMFYAPVMFQSSIGVQLRSAAQLFRSKEAGFRFLGYMKSQTDRLAGERGQKGVNRPELVEKYGYDTKYAYHIIRLGMQGIEFIEEGKISVPLPETVRDLLLAIRHGAYPLEKVLLWAKELEARLRQSIDESELPETAPELPINTLLENFHSWAWQKMW